MRRCTIVLSMPLITMLLLVIGGFDLMGQWQRVTLPGKYDTQMYLDVFFLPANPNYGWAVSLEGGIVRTTDRGATWRGGDLPDQNVFLEHIHFLDRFNGYISGPAGIYRSNDGGATWRNITPPGYEVERENGWGCFFRDINRGVFLSGGCGTAQSFYYTTDGGENWRRDRHTEPQRGLTDAIIFDDGTGYATSSGMLWRTVDGGRTWARSFRTPVNAWTEEITYRNGMMLLPTAGNSCSGGGSQEGTLSWGDSPSGPWRTFQTGQTMYGTFIIDDQKGWGVGSNGACYYTSNAGVDWILRDCGINGADLDDIWFISENEGWIAGRGLFRSRFDRGQQIQIVGPKVVDLCPSETYSANVVPGLRNVVWSSGQRGNQTTLGEGIHTVTGMDTVTCTISTDTILIRVYPVVPPIINAGEGGSEHCAGTATTLRVTNGPYRSYRWNTGSQDDSITVIQSGLYAVTVVDSNGCTTTAQWQATFREPLVAAIAPIERTTICSDDSVELAAPGGYSYEWSTGSTEQRIVVRTSGRYAVRIIDDLGCDATSDSIEITVLNIRNRIDITRNVRPLVVPSHAIEQRSCVEIQIHNLDSVDALVIHRPFLVRNLLFSLPLSQFPVVIPAAGQGVVRICAATVDSGWVSDTIIFSDTCRPQILPVTSYGATIEFASGSRCDVPVGITAYSAGSAHRITAPVPNPTGWRSSIHVRGPAAEQPPTVSLVSAMGAAVAEATIDGHTTDGTWQVWSFTFDVTSVSSGMYVVVATNGQSLRHTQPLSVIR
jgi:photosystem II stability/assembly factor-like uncharacterized protein